MYYLIVSVDPKSGHSLAGFLLVLARTRPSSRGSARNGFSFPFMWLWATFNSLQFQDWELKCFTGGWLESVLSFWRPQQFLGTTAVPCRVASPAWPLSPSGQQRVSRVNLLARQSHITESQKWHPITFAIFCGLEESQRSIFTQGHEHEGQGSRALRHLSPTAVLD